MQAANGAQWVPMALVPEIRRQHREADHSPMIYTSSPPYDIFIVKVSVTEQERKTLSFVGNSFVL
jgi:hypothetical protein